MKTVTIREARDGLSHPETLFADANEVLVTKHGKPVVRLLPPITARKVRSLATFRAKQVFQTVSSEVIIAQEREERI